MDETTIIYFIGDQEMPYLVNIPILPERVTLADFKNVLDLPNYKYFFNAMDDEFGVAKIQIVDDDAILPCFNGRGVSWLVSAEPAESKSCQTRPYDVDSFDGHQKHTRPLRKSRRKLQLLRERKMPSLSSSTESTDSGVFLDRITVILNLVPVKRLGMSIVSSEDGYIYVGSIVEGETVSLDGRLENGDRILRVNDVSFENITHDDAVTVLRNAMTPKKGSIKLVVTKCLDPKPIDPSPCPRADDRGDVLDPDLWPPPSPSSFTDASSHSMSLDDVSDHSTLPSSSALSTMTADSIKYLDRITVTLNPVPVKWLGIRVVGCGDDGGIFVNKIMEDGPVALDGRIEFGDRIVQVNDICLEGMTNDNAERVLRQSVLKPGPIILIVAKCFDSNSKDCLKVSHKNLNRNIVSRVRTARVEVLPKSCTTSATSSSSHSKSHRGIISGRCHPRSTPKKKSYSKSGRKSAVVDTSESGTPEVVFDCSEFISSVGAPISRSDSDFARVIVLRDNSKRAKIFRFCSKIRKGFCNVFSRCSWSA